MALIIEMSLNGTKTIACYGIRRVTHTDVTKPHGEMCRYEIRKAIKNETIGCWAWDKRKEPEGYVSHAYDDPVERLVELAMQKIQEAKE